MKLADDDQVVSLIVPSNEGDSLTVSQNGYGKRSGLAECGSEGRATQGVVSIKVSERNGPVVGAVQEEAGDEMMMITDAGTLVRTRVAEVSQVGRNTQGVTLIRTAEDESVVGLQRIDEVEEVELPEGEEAETTEANAEQQAPEAPAADDAEEGKEE
ncbi:DNA gyrase subunit A, partial [Vibrio parahaemolyticus]|uniref:DNA gyrase C-terminal beta-propeller domain-containing protein n=1 Tax=Vibrio parahaemolyticus TaxID=670 RepID=UPI0009C6D3BC